VDRARERISNVMLQIKSALKANEPVLTSVKDIGVAEDSNPLHRESMEVLLSNVITFVDTAFRMVMLLLISLAKIPNEDTLVSMTVTVEYL
jgi:hypothetical protein